MRLKIKINPLAINDVKMAKEYIREENVNAINKFTQEIERSIENLSEFPLSLANCCRRMGSIHLGITESKIFQRIKSLKQNAFYQ